MSTQILVGELRTGRITGVLPVLPGAAWKRVLDDAGDISRVVLTGESVRELNARLLCAPARSFLAVESADRIWQAGPIWTHGWDWSTQRLTLGAGGLWSLLDHRKVLPVLAAGQSAATASTTISGTDLGGIARALVDQALQHVGGDLPLDLPAARVGTRTETFPGYGLPDLGEELRQLTTRESAAPNLRFTARRRSDDPEFLRFAMEAGTEAQPQLTQAGADWYFDTTVPRSPVKGISVSADATAMGTRAWVTGSGTDASTPIAVHDDPTLIAAGYPLLEVEESRNGEDLTALATRARSLSTRRSRPVQTWQMTVRADAVREVLEGDHVRVVVKDDPYLADGEHRLRVAQLSGDTGEDVVLAMVPVLATV